MKSVERFKELVDGSQRIVGFTGAGVSTESGIADYRSQGGIWDKFQPVYFDEFKKDEAKRKLYWERKEAMWQTLKEALPGPAHTFFTQLYAQGKLRGLITQNIDGLHEKSGLPPEMMVNLHGTSLEIACLDCHDIQPAEMLMDHLDLTHGCPRCQKCNGLLKPNTISFGQSLEAETLQRAEELARNCDLLIAAGSTLVVHPAASYPLLAKQAGARLVILTLSETPLDQAADLVINESIGTFLQKLSSLGPTVH